MNLSRGATDPSTLDTERTKAHVKRPELGDLEMTIHALRGILWALNMLVVHPVADGTAHEKDLNNGIDCLIFAGEQLAAENGRTVLGHVARIRLHAGRH